MYIYVHEWQFYRGNSILASLSTRLLINAQHRSICASTKHNDISAKARVKTPGFF